MSFRSSICMYDNSIMKVLLKACLKYKAIAFTGLERLFVFSLDMEFGCFNIIANVLTLDSRKKKTKTNKNSIIPKEKRK